MDEGPGLGRLVRETFKHPPGTEEHEKAHAELDRALERMAKRAPDQRHSTRMRAIYVDLKDSGIEWNRPAELTAREATTCLTQAVNDYANQRHRLVSGTGLDPRLATALAAWTSKPELPEAAWPKMFP